jgi:cell division protein FtsQ
MTTTPTPTLRIDPRIRERLIAVRRQAGRRRLRWLIVALSLIAAIGLSYLVVTSPILDVDHVRVGGAQHVTAEQVRAAAHIGSDDALLFVNAGAIARRVEEALPWVERATVERAFPGTVRITVHEYAPTAFVRAGNALVLLAADGRAIARVATAPAGAVEVRGIRRAPNTGEYLAPMEASNIVPRLPRALAERVRAVDVGGGALSLQLAAGGTIRLGNANELDAKAQAALAVLAHLADASFNYIDVSTPQRPVSHQ